MVIKATAVMCFVLAGFTSADMLIKESFDGMVGQTPNHPSMQRFEQVSIVNGRGPIGEDPAMRFNDASDKRPGILEYNPGQAPSGAYYISFNLLNNDSSQSGDADPIVFCMGAWGTGRGIALGANATRGFALEFLESGNTRTLSARIGKSTVSRGTYVMSDVQKVKILVNDHDSIGIPYVRPDTKEQAVLNPDSVVMFVNNQLLTRMAPSGVAMQSSVSKGDRVLGRVGFSSSTAATVDFLIDNFTVMSIPAPEPTPEPVVVTPSLSSGPKGQGGEVYLHETFDAYELGAAPKIPFLQRVTHVTVADGGSKVGDGKVARFDDSDTSSGGAMEYNFGEEAPGSLYVEFDACNNARLKGDKSASVIFGVASWGYGSGLALNSKARRAFGFEMYQKTYLKLRVGDDTATTLRYDSKRPFNVKIWVNDNDENTLSYKRPDTGADALLNPDSVVVWLDNRLFGKLKESGYPMNQTVTEGNAVIGRFGFGSSTKAETDFLIDNLHAETPSGEFKPAAGSALLRPVVVEETPTTLPDTETMTYRDGENAMNLFVNKPEGWTAGDKRSAYIYFFGGGWTRGTPLKSASVASWAAAKGMVGIVPDYRTQNRFGTSPLESVADARAAFNWVVEHADELGIDPTRIAVGGNSAGGHLALWTAISETPAGSNPAESSSVKPAAVVLTSAVTDTSPETGYTPSRFGADALALSPVDQLDERMPPVLMFHATDDTLVHYGTAVALHDHLKAAGNECELVTVPRGGHGFSSKFPEWKTKARVKIETLFQLNGLLPAVR